MTIHASFVSNYGTDDIFNPKSKYNRDNCLLAWRTLKSILATKNILLKTEYQNNCFGIRPQFQIELNVSTKPTLSKERYAICLEPRQLAPYNYNFSLHKSHKAVFTFDDQIIDGLKYKKIFFPNDLSKKSYDFTSFESRSNFIAMIAGNKRLPSKDLFADLYLQRIEYIQFFSDALKENFSLYGSNWNLPFRKAGLINTFYFRFNKLLPQSFQVHNRSTHYSYKGYSESKQSILTRTKFLICFENLSDNIGYISEKIIDSFIYGCVPVYWGPINANSYIPKDCYIDIHDFPSKNSLLNYLTTLDKNQFERYQNSIRNFLCSPKAFAFTTHYFAKKISDVIFADFNL